MSLEYEPSSEPLHISAKSDVEGAFGVAPEFWKVNLLLLLYYSHAYS